MGLSRHSSFLSAFVASISLGVHLTAQAEVYKCVDKAGKTAYQDAPCREDAKSTTLQIVPSPAPPPPKSQVPSDSLPRATMRRVPNPPPNQGVDSNGPRETFDRFTKSLRRGDKQGALNELTPEARRQHGPAIEALTNAPAAGQVPRK